MAGFATKSPACSWAASSDSTSCRRSSSSPQALLRNAGRLCARQLHRCVKQLADFLVPLGIHSRPLQLPEEPCLRQAPVPSHGSHRHVEHVRRFLQAQSAEESQLDDAALPRVQCLQGLQRVIQCHEIDAPVAADVRRLRQRDVKLAAAAFRAVSRPRHVDQDTAHDLRGHGKEVGAVLPAYVLPIDQPQVGLVDERRRLEDVSRALARHVSRREAMQLLVNQRRQRLERGLVAAAPRGEQLRDVRRGTHQVASGGI